MSLCHGPGRRARLPARRDRARHTGALRGRGRRATSTSSGRSGTASDSTSSGRFSSAAGSASRRSRTWPRRSAIRPRCSASAASGTPRPLSCCRTPSVVVEPTYVTEPLAELVEGHDVLACGPEPMLEAVRARPRGPAGLGGADGVRLRRLLRMLGGDRRRPQASLRGRPSPGGRMILNASGLPGRARGAGGRARHSTRS